MSGLVINHEHMQSTHYMTKTVHVYALLRGLDSSKWQCVQTEDVANDNANLFAVKTRLCVFTAAGRLKQIKSRLNAAVQRPRDKRDFKWSSENI